MRNYNQLQSLSDQEFMLDMIKTWSKQSNNADLLKFRNALMRNSFYVNSLEMERETFDKQLDETQMQFHRVLLRAQRAEQKIADQDKRIKELEASLKAFGL